MQENDTIREVPGLTREAEEQQLAFVTGVAQENLERARHYNQKLTDELHDMLETYKAKDKEGLALWHNTEAQLLENERDLLRAQKARQKPYFGRIDFKDPAAKAPESYYVGRVGIAKDGFLPLVIDWRAPVASVYYENSIGTCTYEVKDEDDYAIDLKRKRTYEIAEDKLIDFFDSDVVANDDLLTKYLAKSKKAVLSEIIGTIQKEQNAIIRKSPKLNLIVQGVAGSGKTTVAMHRISYILYNYESFRPEEFYIIGSNRILLNYITGVLPDLDVYGISQMTMEQLFVRLLYEDWDRQKYSVRLLDKKGEEACIKGSYAWFHELEAFCREYERREIPRGDVHIEKNGVLLMKKQKIDNYLRNHPELSMQSKINMLNEFLLSSLENELLGKHVSYSTEEKKALQKSMSVYFGKDVWRGSIFDLYHDFLQEQREKGKNIFLTDNEFDLYDLAALAYLYKRIKETDGIREASHVIIDEAQDFGMMAYGALVYCLRGCTYTIMGDVSQNIHYGYGLNDWEDLKELVLRRAEGSFGLLKKSYRNTVEISHFATEILHHGNFPIYAVEPIIRHGNEVQVLECKKEAEMLERSAELIESWQKEGHETIAVICRDEEEAEAVSKKLGTRIPLADSNLETAKFDRGVMVLPVEYTKGLEFDAVLIYHPSMESYPAKDRYVKLLYVAATRALHELAVVHTGDLTELIGTPVSKEKKMKLLEEETKARKAQEEELQSEKKQTTAERKLAAKKRAEQALADAAKEKEKRSYMGPKQILVPEAKKPVVPPARAFQKTNAEEENPSPYQFGDVPDSSRLVPKGHSRIDCSIRWVKKSKEYLELASNYGILRLTPVAESIIRVQFQKGQTADFVPGYWEYVPESAPAWSARKGKAHYELQVGQIVIRIEKSTGALQFFNKKGTLLLAEKAALPRQMEAELPPAKTSQTWSFFDWGKNEKLVAKGILDDNLLRMNQKARYISFGKKKHRMPLVISDRGYGLGVAAESTVMCCNIPMYGPYLYTEDMKQIDYYFIYGENQSRIIELYQMCRDS